MSRLLCAAFDAFRMHSMLVRIKGCELECPTITFPEFPDIRCSYCLASCRCYHLISQYNRCLIGVDGRRYIVIYRENVARTIFNVAKNGTVSNSFLYLLSTSAREFISIKPRSLYGCIENRGHRPTSSNINSNFSSRLRLPPFLYSAHNS